MTRKDQSPATLETIASQLEKLSKDVGFLDRSIKTLAGRIEAYEGERGSKRSGPCAKTTLPPALLAAALNGNIRNRLTPWRNAAFPRPSRLWSLGPQPCSFSSWSSAFL